MVGVTPHTISRCEIGKTAPTEENIAAFARALQYPIEFFFGPDISIPDPDLVSFRSQKAMTAGVRDAALAAGSIGFLVSDWIESRFDLPEISVPDLDHYDPAAAAISLRQFWGLGHQPISNMVHLLESKGVRVFSLAENSKTVNAFSLWRDEKPYVFLNTMKTAENSRFDAAHELGHLVLHQDGKTTGRKAEEEANNFASEFLMPHADMLAYRANLFSISKMIQAKKRWKVSLAALNYRMHKLNFITEWRYRDFCIRIASDYGHTEPDGIDREKSVVWQKVMKALWAEKITQADIARALYVPVEEVNTLIFGILYSGATEQPPRYAALELIKK